MDDICLRSTLITGIRGGVSVDEVKEAIIKEKKSNQIETGLIEAFYRFFSVVYDEILLKDQKIRKIYPVTVKLW